MGRLAGYTQKQILKAVKDSGGIISTIADRLKCDWHTAEKYVNKFDSTRQAYADENEVFLDSAVSVLKTKIEEQDLQAAKWLLATKGKHRGFTERQEITGADGVPIEIKINKLGKEDAKQLTELMARLEE